MEVFRNATTPVLASTLAVLSSQDAAAASGQYQGFAPAQFRQYLALAAAKARFAFLLEDVGDINTGVAFDFSIAVGEGRTDQPGKRPAHGGLAGAHWTDQVDVALAQHGPQSIRPPEGGRMRFEARVAPT